MSSQPRNAEEVRLREDARRIRNWQRWGPYLAERQWGTVREDYSASGNCWEYFPHDHARSRAYRWGEDGLLGFTDRECRLCFGVALWNGRDPILKERLFGLAGPEGNHGEDVKECYYYLDSTPTHSYMKSLYKYPQAEFPYFKLVDENRRRNKRQPEYELTDTGVFDDNRYFDVVCEFAKAGPDDLLLRIVVTNHGDAAARLHVLPQLWFRNTWSWGRKGEGYWPRPELRLDAHGVRAQHASLPAFRFVAAPASDGTAAEYIFTENETNTELLYGSANAHACVKDGFHAYIVRGHQRAIARDAGTKMAAHYPLLVAAGATVTLSLRLTAETEVTNAPFDDEFEAVFAARRAEADQFYEQLIPSELNADERAVSRQAYAGLLFSRQYYHYCVEHWQEGDPSQPVPPPERLNVRNADWRHLYNRDVLSMPDKWEYPWYAAWDLAFHMIPYAAVDPQFAKRQLRLVLREWYLHPNGQIPAYEFNFSDVNPPVHAWAAWRVYKMTAPRGERDISFLTRIFQKLLVNFTWWVNRKDLTGRHVFSGGFLGLDNIGVFDRSRPLPTGGFLEQADGTAWMGFYCGTMMSIALELASVDIAYEDMASKFFEHFIAIIDAMNTLDGTGLWDNVDGFYYDHLHVGGRAQPLRIRSLVGLLPLIAAEVIDEAVLEKLPGFRKRLQWFLRERPELSRYVQARTVPVADAAEGATTDAATRRFLLAIPSRERLQRTLRYLVDETEFLSPFGIRSLSRAHRDRPFQFQVGSEILTVDYQPGESTTEMFGGNSNWRGPIWFPINYLLIEALERYSYFYGDALTIECPSGSGQHMNLAEVAAELNSRLVRLFLPDRNGERPCHGHDVRYAQDPAWRDLVLFHEYFHGDTGLGLGASHQTGWTALALRCLESHARSRTAQQSTTIDA
ncbi:MAG: MGH1-like glycoside hydrolase domain-containing protein [Planctomycetota bacterium]